MRRDGQSTIGHDMQNFNRYLHNHKHINIGSSYTLRIILWRTQTPKFWLKHTFTSCPGLLPFILGNELIAVKQSMTCKFLYITRTVKDVLQRLRIMIQHSYEIKFLLTKRWMKYEKKLLTKKKPVELTTSVYNSIYP